jgi:hypothetical protein
MRAGLLARSLLSMNVIMPMCTTAIATLFGNPPSATWIGVPSLANNEFLVEVEPSMIFLPRE